MFLQDVVQTEAGTVRIEPVDLQSVTDDQVQAYTVFGNALLAERRPEDPPHSVEETGAGLRNIPPFVDVRAWAGWTEDGCIAAEGSVVFLRTEENRHLAQMSLRVLPPFRRHGLARQMLARVVPVAEAEQRRLLVTDTDGSVPAGAAFLRRLGAEPALEEHTNQLLLSDLSRDLLRDWQAKAPTDAFELGVWVGPYPEDELEAITALLQSINDMPRGSLDMEDFRWTPAQIRQQEASLLAQGTERWTMYAREKSSGALAGWTELFWSPHRPTRAGQGGTAVWPQYRGRGLGRWLKAAMLQKLVDERPQVDRVRTGNADSNAAMLKINHELGFKPYQSACVWQISVAAARAYLEGAVAEDVE